jgi:hypothetical protein
MTQTPGAVTGSASASRRHLLAAAVGSAIWIMAAAAYGLWSWSAAHAQLQQAFDDGTRGCRQRYGERTRQERCIDLFRILYEGDRNAAIFTRVVIALLPPAAGLGGLGLWRVIGRRGRREAAHRRRVD